MPITFHINEVKGKRGRPKGSKNKPKTTAKKPTKSAQQQLVEAEAIRTPIIPTPIVKGEVGGVKSHLIQEKIIGKGPKANKFIKEVSSSFAKGQAAEVPLPKVGDIQLDLPKYVIAEKAQGAKSPYKYRLANPTTTARNLSTRKQVKSVSIMRKAVEEPNMETAVGGETPTMKDFSPADQKKLIEYFKEIRFNEGSHIPVGEIKQRGKPLPCPCDGKVKRSRGRPRTKPLPNPDEPKRPRGRPPGKAAPKAVKAHLKSLENEDEDEEPENLFETLMNSRMEEMGYTPPPKPPKTAIQLEREREQEAKKGRSKGQILFDDIMNLHSTTFKYKSYRDLKGAVNPLLIEFNSQKESGLADDIGREQVKIAQRLLKSIIQQARDMPEYKKAKAGGKGLLSPPIQMKKYLAKMDYDSSSGGGTDTDESEDGGDILGSIKKAGQSAVKGVSKVAAKVEKKRKDTVHTIKDVSKKLVYGTTELPPKAKAALDKFSGATITKATIIRIPLSEGLMTVLNTASGGDFKKKVEKEPYDTLYHLRMDFETDQGVVTSEKNEVINICAQAAIPPKAEFMEVPMIPEGLTFGQMIENTKQSMGNKFLPYSSKDNNCMNFVMGMLVGNGMNTPATQAFALTDVKRLFSDTFRKTTNSFTDLGAKIQIIQQGGSIAHHHHHHYHYGNDYIPEPHSREISGGEIPGPHSREINGGEIPEPPSRSYQTDPSLIEGGKGKNIFKSVSNAVKKVTSNPVVKQITKAVVPSSPFSNSGKESKSNGIFGEEGDKLMKQAGVKDVLYKVGDAVKPLAKQAIGVAITAAAKSLIASQPQFKPFEAGAIAVGKNLANDYMDHPKKYRDATASTDKMVKLAKEKMLEWLKVALQATLKDNADPSGIAKMAMGGSGFNMKWRDEYDETPEAGSNGVWGEYGKGLGGKVKLPHQIKGSQEAKDHMRKLREMRQSKSA